MKSCSTIGFHQYVCHSPSELADAIHPDANNACEQAFHKILIVNFSKFWGRWKNRG